MCGEAGEAANVVKKLRRNECGLRGNVDADPTELVEQLASEIADVILYADLLATKYGIDVPSAIISKFNEISEREGLPQRLEP
jgi:NTP pyrophosphatase (non-canonical NTP hydrolase)